MQLSDRQQEIIDEFQFFDSWMDKYQYLIDLGHELEPLTEEEKNENNVVRGCQSQVWMVVDGDAANVTIRANSDAAIVSGLIALVVRLYSKASAEEIIKTEPEFVEALGLSQHLSPTRANGLASMLQRLKAETAQLIAKS
ncbi:MAG: SufE family protein [Litorivicinaceae bacterium]|nr:Fe-S metabolism protein SufE [Gammaproteobacteria bacterium]RPG20264.1 MAG: SufE family protein [Oceanospirillales bacterium TMED33]RZO75477.1 MAG: SufE family protein [Litorivicinaceae bacterium]CAI8386070.1 MAG: Cysteine desulfuration protein SufE [Gammaproteobacteria bacterium]|tara:strand:- start:446 stop:865 length:420 start_codon:yes stop_codon:yes gene_type:complete